MRSESVCDAEPPLQLLQRHSFGFGIERRDQNKVNQHHGREEEERRCTRFLREHRKQSGYQRIHDPQCRGPNRLPLGANARRKDFAHVHPDHSTLRDGEETHERHDHPDQP